MSILPLEIVKHRVKYSDSLQQIESIYFKRILKQIRREYLDNDMSWLSIATIKIGRTEIGRWEYNSFFINEVCSPTCG